MPHVVIKCYPGRSEEQKELCSQKVADAISEAMGCNLSSVSIDIVEVEQKDWKKEVWDKEINPNMDNLYKKPGYKCE